MIGVLRPQSPHKANSSSNNREDSWLQRSSLKAGASGERYYAGNFYDQDQDDLNEQLLSASSPTLPDNEDHVIDDAHTLTRGADGNLAVAVLQSARDTNEIAGLQNAKVGALHLAVVRENFQRVTRAILKGHGSSSSGDTLEASAKSGYLAAKADVSLSTATGTLRAVLRRVLGSGGLHDKKDAGACLVLYCKFPGGIVACPLDGASFRLREGAGDVRGSIGASGVSNGTPNTASWSLPETGFNALCDAEKSIVPGLPALARDMASDVNCFADDADSLSAQTLSSRLGAQGRPYVVVPHTSGIHVYSGVFTRISHHHAALAGATRRRAMTVARLEKAEAGKGTGTRQRFVLEDYEYGVRFSWGRGDKRVEITKRRSRIGRRILNLPVTYAKLLGDARSWWPTGLGDKLASGTLRWPFWKGRRYQAASGRIVPGLGEDIFAEEAEKKQPCEPPLSRGDRGLTGGRQNAGAQNAGDGGCDGELDVSGSLPQDLVQHPQLLTSHCVEAASFATATLWASTPNMLLALLAAACSACEERHDSRAEEEPPKVVKGEGAAGEQARLAVCSLLFKVFRTACSQDTGGQADRERSTKRDKHAALLDMWYESFWRVAVPFDAVAEDDEKGPAALQYASRLLLERMLDLEEVREGFLRRGLLQRLAKGLRSRGADWSRGVQAQGSDSCRLGGDSRSTVLQQAPQHASDRIDVAGSGEAWNTGGSVTYGIPFDSVTRGAAVVRRDMATEDSPSIMIGSSEANHHHHHGVPWWLFHAKCVEDKDGGEGEGREGGGGAANEPTRDDCHHGSTDEDTRESTEVDESCNTVSDGEYVLGENGLQTSRDDDRTDDNDIAEVRDVGFGSDLNACLYGSKDGSWGLPSSARGGLGAFAGGDAARERVAPPLLRLDALDTILGNKEWETSPGCSPHVTTTLSAASTRPPAHLPTFRSARGMTSRASARHGSSRSGRTERTTQRDSVSPGGYPMERNTSPAARNAELDPVVSSLSGPPPLWTAGDTVAAAAAMMPVSAGKEADAFANGSFGTVDTIRWTSLRTDHVEGGREEPAVSARYADNGGVVGEVVVGGIRTLDDNNSAALAVSGYGNGGGGDDSNNVRGVTPLLQLAALTPHTGAIAGVEKGSTWGAKSLGSRCGPQLISTRDNTDEAQVCRGVAAAPSLTMDVNPSQGIQGLEDSAREQVTPGDSSHLSSSAAACPAAAPPEDSWVTTGHVENGVDKARLANVHGSNEASSQRVLRSPTNPLEQGVVVTGHQLKAGSTNLGRISCGDHKSSHIPPRAETPPNIAASRAWEADNASPTHLVFSLARASAPVPTPNQQQAFPRDDRDMALASQIADAKLVLSLLPAAAADSKTSVDTQEVLDVALAVLSLAGTLSWIEVYTPTASFVSAPSYGFFCPCGEERRSVPRSAASAGSTKGATAAGAVAGAWQASSIWPTELDVVDFTVLARSVRCLFDDRCSLLQSHLNGGGGREGMAYDEVASSSHREWVHTACQRALECTWYTRFLLRKVVAAGTLDGEFRASSSLPAETITETMKLCGSALEMLQGLCFPSVVIDSNCGGGSGGCCREDSGHYSRTGLPEEDEFTLRVGEMLLLFTAPAAIDLVASLMELLHRSLTWGDNLAWAAKALTGDDIGTVLPVLVGLTERLVRGLQLGPTPVTPGHDNQQQLSPDDAKRADSDSAAWICSGARSLAGRLAAGGRGAAVLDELLIVALDTLDAFMNRSKTLMEASQDLASLRQTEGDDNGERYQSEEVSLSVEAPTPLRAATSVGETARGHDRGGLTTDSRLLCTSLFPPDSKRRVEVLNGARAVEVHSGRHTDLEWTRGPSAVVRAETAAIFRVIRDVSPVFRPAGPILTLLGAQFLCRPPSKHNEKTDLSITATWTLSGCQNNPLAMSGADFSTSLASALRACISFFFVMGEACWSDDDGVVGVEHFVDLLWSGFRLRYTGRARGEVFLPKHKMQRRQVESRYHGRVETQGSCFSWPREDQHALLCRLHLEALAKLASTHNPVVHARLHELRVPQFLLQDVLGAGGFSGRSTHCSAEEASVDQARELNQSSPDDPAVENSTDTVFNDEPSLAHPMESVTQSAGEPASGLPFQRAVGYSAHQEEGGNVQESSDVHRANSGICKEPCERPTALHITAVDYVPPPTGTGIADDPVLGQEELGSGSRARDERERLVRGAASTGLENADAGVGVVLFAVGDTVDGLVKVRSGRSRWFTGRVEKINEDGTLHILYNDGDEEVSKNRRDVRQTRRINTGTRHRPSCTGRNERGASGGATPRLRYTREITRTGSSVPKLNDAVCANVNSAAAIAPGVSHVRRGSLDHEGKIEKGAVVDEMQHTSAGMGGNSEQTHGRLSAREGASRTTGSVAGGSEGSMCTIARRSTPESVAHLVQVLSLSSDAGVSKVVTEIEALNSRYGSSTVAIDPTVVAASVDESDDDDNIDDDMYFVIPSVLNPESATDVKKNDLRPCVSAPASTVPMIDLQSSVFRTRVRSSQLGPGSSLSTPTTGGIRGGGASGDALRGRGGGTRSDSSLVGWQSTSSAGQRPASFVSRSPIMSAGPRVSASRGSDVAVMSRAAVLARYSSLTGASGVASGARESQSTVVGISRSEGGVGDDDETGGPGGIKEARRFNVRKVDPIGQNIPNQFDTKDERVSPTTTSVPQPEGRQAAPSARDGYDEGDRRALDGLENAWQRDRNSSDGLNTRLLDVATSRIHESTVALLLALACQDGGSLMERSWPASSSAPNSSSGESEPFVVNAMSALQRYFEEGVNENSCFVVPSLDTRWSSRRGAEGKAESAVLAKLVCCALFDAGSYSLDGEHIAAGTFGCVVVSRSPLPLGTGRRNGAPLSATAPTTGIGRIVHGTGGLSLHEPEQRPTVVALKVVERDPFDLTIGPNAFDEVLALRVLADVPGVCHLHDFGVTPTSYILVMERCALSLKSWRVARATGEGCAKSTTAVSTGSIGNDAWSLSGGEAPRSDREVILYLVVFRQIASAVAAMADRGVIHFDLKCDNVLVREGEGGLVVSPSGIGRAEFGALLDEVPSVCVGDFGEAVVRRKPGPRRQATSAHSPSSPCDREADHSEHGCGVVVRRARGTERIQSPEMIRLVGGGSGGCCGGVSPASEAERVKCMRVGSLGGAITAGKITTASDVWSLGCLLYELLSGVTLFDDLPFSEFFVTLTRAAGKEEHDGRNAGDSIVVDGGGVASAGHVPREAQPPSSILPPTTSLRRFEGLRSADVIKGLLEFMLVRDPAARPSAFAVVRRVDDALAAIVTASADVPTTDRTKGMSILTNPPPPTNQLASCKTTRAVTREPAAVELVHGDELGTREGSEIRQMDEYPTENTAEGATVSSNADDDNDGAGVAPVAWPLQPCGAVHMRRILAARRSAHTMGCSGCLYRLGSPGAFLLVLNLPQDGDLRVVDRAVATSIHLDSSAEAATTTWSAENAEHGGEGHTQQPSARAVTERSKLPIGPETTVLSAEDVASSSWATAGVPVDGFVTTATTTTLGSLLPSAGISHVVYITTGQKTDGTRLGENPEQRGNSVASGGSGQTRPRPCIRVSSRGSVEEGSRLLSVEIGSDDNTTNGDNIEGAFGRSFLPSGSTPAGFVGDMLDFVTGPRALFVEREGDGGFGGAAAMAWAMSRTEKGLYETMLEFRQACPGFWVDPAVLRAVMGE